jgi:hypothetical protein
MTARRAISLSLPLIVRIPNSLLYLSPLARRMREARREAGLLGQG